MTLFLDTEFNGFGGELISLALISDDGGEFYGVRKLPKKIHPWVRQNVIPVLDQEPESDAALRRRLASFLTDHDGEGIIADWPLDFAYYLNFMCVRDKMYGPATLNMKLVPQLPLDSERPHNALSDARALLATCSK